MDATGSRVTRRTPAKRAGTARAAAPAARPPGSPLAAWALALLAGWALLLLLAPPLSTHAWAVNGFRSVGPAAKVGLLLAAAAAGLLVWRGRGAFAWAAVAVAAALVLALPLREGAHVLGDTDMRLHAIAEIAAPGREAALGEWARRVHANPLDFAVDVAAPAALVRAGLSGTDAVAAVGALLALLFFAALWRATGAFASGERRFALTAVLALTGALQAFAGYAESAALLLVVTAWWWSELARPLDRVPRALVAALAWFALALVHRSALVLLLPQLGRALLPWPDDRVRPRAVLAGATLAALAAVLWLPGLDLGARQVGADLAPLRKALAELPALPPLDVANGLLLVAPLVLAAVLLLAGARDDAGAAATAPGAGLAGPVPLALAGGVPLALLAIVGWSAPNGLGAMRDWDLPAAAGLLLSFAAAAALGRSPRVGRAALAWVAPVLALQAFAWVAVNADAQAGLARASRLIEKPGRVTDGQRGTLFMLFATRALERGDLPLAARLQRRAFDVAPDPATGTLAAELLIGVGDRAGARAVLARVHTLEAPDAETARVIAGLDSLLAAPAR